MTDPSSFSRLCRQFSRLAPISDGEWEEFLPLLQPMSIPRGSHFVEENQIQNGVAFVLQGAFRQYYRVEEEERTTYFFFEDHLMADYLGCLRKAPSRIGIQALEDSELLVFAYSELEKRYARSSEWLLWGKNLAEYLAMGLEERMVGLLTRSPEQRYLDLVEGNRKKIMERIPQRFIANYLGISPVSLSRIRGRIAKAS